MKTTRYFEEEVLEKRPYLEREWCERVRRNPEETEIQENGRIRHWAEVPELAGVLAVRTGKKPEESTSYLRVVTLEDSETVHNAMPDGKYARKKRRRQ